MKNAIIASLKDFFPAIATMAVAVSTAFAATNGLIPGRWLIPVLGGMPALTCLLTTWAVQILASREEANKLRQEPSNLGKLQISVEAIDNDWHQPLDLADRFKDDYVGLLGNITHDINTVYDDKDTWEQLRCRVGTTIAANSLRTVDAVLTLLRAGHPDAAMGTTRQIAEMAIVMQVIATDPTGMNAKRYQDVCEVRYLQAVLDTGRTSLENKPVFVSRLSQIKDDYTGLEIFDQEYGWIKPPESRPLKNMSDVIRYVRDRYHKKSDHGERRAREYEQQWKKLSNWSHANVAAFRRSLGTRNQEGEPKGHLVEKSKTGLDDPLQGALFFLHETMIAYNRIAYEVTETSHSESLVAQDEMLQAVCETLLEVKPELIAGDSHLVWK